MFESKDTQPVALEADELEAITPLLDQVLVRPDPPKDTTKSGIVLPDSVRIPAFRATVLAVSWMIKQRYKEMDVPEDECLDTGDRVVCHFKDFIPSKADANVAPVLISINNILGKVKKNGRRHNPQPAKQLQP